MRTLYEAGDGRLADDPFGERHREDLQVNKYVGCVRWMRTLHSSMWALTHSLTHLQCARREREGPHGAPLLTPLELGCPRRHVRAHAVAAHGELVLDVASR